MNDNHLEEFKQLSENIRHWERLRWVSMTVFIVIMGSSLSVILYLRTSTSLYSIHMLKIISFFFVLIFWVQDERIVAYWFQFKKRATKVEEKLEIKVFSITPKRGWIHARIAVRLLYFIFFIVWIILLFNVKF